MGIMKWLARKGAVGGTTRWAAKGFKVIKQQYPNLEDDEVYRKLIKSRYAVMSNPEQEAYLIGLSSQIGCLRDLIISVLNVETELSEVTHSHKEMLLEIIDEELRKQGFS